MGDYCGYCGWSQDEDNEQQKQFEALLAERDEALKIAGCIPSDILTAMLTPPICGESRTSVELGFTPERTGGCGNVIQELP